MHIKKLSLTNFRAAKSLHLDLHRRLNVFVGENGAGKTSVLDAAAILLSRFTDKFLNIENQGIKIKQTDIKNGEPFTSLDITLNENVNWNIVKSRDSEDIINDTRYENEDDYYSDDKSSSLKNAFEAVKLMKRYIYDNDKKVNIPIISYYPTNRAISSLPLSFNRWFSCDMISTYTDSLLHSNSFESFFDWFFELENFECENRRISDHNIEQEDIKNPNQSLKLVRDVINIIAPEFSDLTIHYNPFIYIEIKKHGKRMSFVQLSHGEKQLIAMIGDITRRIILANQERENPLEGDGIIMIDNIELHLHPKHQKSIVPKLMEIFPNCQFIISTNSPHVINQTRPESLFILKETEDNIEVKRANSSYGKTVDRILEDIMGLHTTRPNEVYETIRNIYEQIDRGDLGSSGEALDELSKDIGEDSELVKARVLIKRKQLIDK